MLERIDALGVVEGKHIGEALIEILLRLAVLCRHWMVDVTEAGVEPDRRFFRRWLRTMAMLSVGKGGKCKYQKNRFHFSISSNIR